jgi:hypothetical protein
MADKLSIKDELSNLYFSCTECTSPIELISFDEKNYLIEFRCLNKESHGIKKMRISYYFSIIKNHKYENENEFKDKCTVQDHHSNNYSSFCFECNHHLCKLCLKGRTHIKHIKNQIIEIQPIQEELEIISAVIENYKKDLQNLEMEKEIEEKKLKDNFENEMSEEKLNLENKILLNDIHKKKEINSNKKEYLSDIENIKKEFENKIKLRKEKYDQSVNIINNKYKLINEKNFIYNKYKIKQIENNYKQNF